MANEDNKRIARLFADEIPEIAAGTIEVKGIARNAGQRTKVALYSHDSEVDCIVACVRGPGTRVHKIVELLGGERVDLVRWEEPPERYIKNALQPLAIEDIALHPDEQRAVVVVSKHQEQVARDQQAENRYLAERLCGWRIEFEVAP